MTPENTGRYEVPSTDVVPPDAPRPISPVSSSAHDSVQRAGSLRCRGTAGHGGNEVVGAAVGVAGGAGDVGLAVGAVVSDGGVSEHGGDCGPVAGASLVGVFVEGDVADPVKSILDVPLASGPVGQVGGLGRFGGQGDD